MPLRTQERGASAVEFAIVVSLLIMLLFGIIQFGIAYNRVQGLQAGAREGGRLGSLSQSSISQIQQRVKDTVSIINTSAANEVNPCPASPSTLAVNKFCINVSRRVNGTLTKLTTGAYDPNAQPCNGPTGQQTVVVDVFYKMAVSIPLWSNVNLNTSGTGEFRCEG